MIQLRTDRRRRALLAGRLSAALGAAVLATGALPSAAVAHPVRQYRAIDLGIPGMVQAINDRAFIWRDGIMTALDVPGRDSRADGINERGQVVGTYDPGTDPHAFLWQPGSVTDLGPGFAWDIDDSGRVVGARLDGQGHAVPCVWSGGRVTDLGLGSSAQAQARSVNNRGWIVGGGWREVADGLDQRGYLWRFGTAIDLGRIGIGETFPADVNDRGQIVGMTGLNNVDDPIPFLWHRGKMINLAEHGVTAGYITTVNNRGELGGSIRNPDSESPAAVYR